MRRTILTVSVLLALSASAMAGQIYTWEDAQGRSHFSAQPPQGQPATRVDIPVTQPMSAVAALPAAPLNDGDTDQQALDHQVKKQVAAREIERQQYCDKVRNNLAQLRNNPRLRVEVDGQARRLNEEERQARIADSEKAISTSCTK
jgi:hypothetical protein